MRYVVFLPLVACAVAAASVLPVRGEPEGSTATSASRPKSEVPVAKIEQNETSLLPVLALDAVADPYTRSLVREVLSLGPRAVLLGNPDEALKKFHFVSIEGEGSGRTVSVERMPFHTALRIQTMRKPQEWQTHIQGFFATGPVHRGDVLYCTAYARLIQHTDGQAQGHGRLYASAERGGNGKNVSALGQSDFEIPAEWTRVHIPMQAQRDFQPGDEMKLMFTFGFTGQTVEFGGVQVINLGPGVDKAALPHAELKLDYPGREANAPWRKAAWERIEKLRKGDLRVRVVDAAGKPVPGARIGVEMKRHTFLFGSSFPTAMLPAEYQQIKPWNDDFKRTAGAAPEDKRRIQQEFLRLFNCSTQGLTWSTWGGADARISQSDIRGGVRWFQERDIPLYNAQAVYPSPEFTAPQVNREVFLKRDREGFRKAVKDYVTMMATDFYPAVRSLQIANEIEGRPQYSDLLGRESVPEWFKWVKEANPKMATEINGPYSLGATIETKGRGATWPQTEGLQYYFDLISWLLKQGAPIDYIGFQNHSGIGAAGPEAVLKTLDAFAAFGKPLEITEFEVGLQNGNDPKQRQFQADYVRDYFIAVFSHPHTRMIMLQDFWQPAAWQFEKASAFFNKDWSMNPHGRAYEDLVLKQWWTRTTGTTGANGQYATRGFKGDYEITVTARGKTQTISATVGDEAAAVTVQLR